MKKIVCIDGTVATKVRARLARYGIMRGIYHSGPGVYDTTTQLVLTAAIDPTMEPTIRQEVESISGASIRD